MKHSIQSFYFSSANEEYNQKCRIYIESSQNDILVHEANNAFEQKRKEKVDLEISRVRELTTVLNGVMRSMHLPEAIEVSAGSGVPPSILQKAAEIRVKGRDPRFA